MLLHGYDTGGTSMAQGKITTRAIEGLRADAVAQQTDLLLWDASLAGFGVRAGKTGHVSFVFQFLVGGRGGKTKRLSIGQYPALSPDVARKEAEKLKADTHNRIDVVERRREALRQQKQELQAQSLEVLVSLYVQEKQEPGRYWIEVARLFEKSVIPALGAKTPVAKISKSDVRHLIKSRGDRPGAARNLFAAMRPFFNWCVREDYLQASPMAELALPKTIKARDRVLTDDEIRAFWMGTEAMGPLFAPFYKLLLLTAQRREEVAGMQWRELDLDNATWTIPAARAKNSKDHIVHLSPMAMEALAGVERKDGSEFVFTTTGSSPISGYSKAKAALDKLMTGHVDGDLIPWRAHDLRRTAASGMARLGFDPHIIERVLNHVSGATGGLVGVYQRYEYMDDRMRALHAWGSFVDQLVNEHDEEERIIRFVPR
jgi:integrase